jgi:hypothetical protein
MDEGDIDENAEYDEAKNSKPSRDASSRLRRCSELRLIEDHARTARKYRSAARSRCRGDNPQEE